MAHSSLGPSLTLPQLDPVVQTHPTPHRFLHPRISPHHISVLQQGPGPSPTTKVDRWMHGWTATGFPHLQKADSQAPMPGVCPPDRGRPLERLCWGDQLLAKCPEGGPRPRGPQARWANQEQHSTWDRYTHISLTLSQVTQSRTERNKNKELVRPQRRQEQAPRAPAGGDTRRTGRWHTQPALWKVS